MPIILANNFPPEHGGIQRYMERVAKSLHDAGDDVLVVAPRAIGDAAFDAAQGYRIIRYRTGSRLIELASMLAAFGRAIISSQRSYTLASIWFPSGLVAACIPRALRGPLGIVAHGTEIAPNRGGPRRFVMRWVFGAADRIFPNSRFTRNLLFRVGIERNIVVIPCGVDAPLSSVEGPERHAFTLLSVGRLIARKGFDTVLSALPSLRNQFPEIRYEIVGDGPYRAMLEAQMRRLALDDSVTFLGSVDAVALERAYRRASCFVLPVRADGDDVEGFGIVYLEAAVAGIPVIGGRDSGAEDAIAPNETGFVVDGRSVTQVVDAVATLLSNPERAKAFGELGRIRALQSFTWQRTAAQIRSTMKSIIAS